jgi:hypothetical protein
MDTAETNNAVSFINTLCFESHGVITKAGGNIIEHKNITQKFRKKKMHSLSTKNSI